MRPRSRRVDVWLHPATRDLFEEVERDHPRLLENLVRDFALYVGSNFDERPRRFGKVERYTSPPSVLSAHLMHIHICMPPPDDFDPRKPVGQMTCRKDQPQRDAALVYVQGEIEEHRYCILALLYPRAHMRANANDLMIRLANLARDFRDRN